MPAMAGRELPASQRTAANSKSTPRVAATRHAHAVEIGQVVAEFGLGEVTAEPAVAAAGWGGHNRVWRIDTGAGAFAVKETRRPLGEGILASIEIERAAVEGGVCAPAPIAAPDGRWVVKDGDVSYRCHEWSAGRTKRNEDATADDAEAMGRLVAGLHGLGLPAQPPEPPSRFGREHWNELAAQAPATEWASLIRDHVDEILSTEAAAPGLQGVCLGSHRDLNAHNVLFDDARLVLIDWDSAGPAWPPHERAAYAVTWAHTESGRLDLDTAVAFLRGYVDGGGDVDRSDPAALAGRLSGLVWWTEQNVRLAIRGIGDDQDKLAALLVQAVIDGPRVVSDQQMFLADAIARL